MPLNSNSIFPPGRGPLVNFNWSDIASATGYAQYQGTGSDTSTGIVYLLTPSGIISHLRSVLARKSTTASSSTTSVFAKLLDLDFDISTFQLPQVVRGTGICCVNWQNVSQGGSTGYTLYHSYVVVRVRKWDGTTETEIASVQSVTKQQTEFVTVKTGVMLPVTIPQTLIKKGEVLRVTVEVWGKGPGVGFVLALLHNPDDTDHNSQLSVALPYKIEV